MPQEPALGGVRVCVCRVFFFFGLVASNDMNAKDVNGGGWVVTSRWDPMAGLVVGMAGEG